MDDSMQGLIQAWPEHTPAIILMDLDAFFASVEQLDHPEWRGKPVIVGGDPKKRGVVSTCSYEARKYGVHSAMASSIAARLCPDAIWTRGHFARYHEMSHKVMDILLEESPFLRQVSVDEAFLDVSPGRGFEEDPVSVAMRIQKKVGDLGITCSIGLGTTKTIAKIASDMDKPHGLTVVYPGSEEEFLKPLPVRALSGIGKATEERMSELGMETLGDLLDKDLEYMQTHFGKSGLMIWNRLHGLEESDLTDFSEDEMKSVSHETSFAVDISTYEDMCVAIRAMAAKVGQRLRRYGYEGTTVTLKLRYANRKLHTAQTRLDGPSDNDAVIAEALIARLPDIWNEGQPIRLVGVAVSGFDTEEDGQMQLFDDEADKTAVQSAHFEKLAHLNESTDRVKARFGDSAVKYGYQIINESNVDGEEL